MYNIVRFCPGGILPGLMFAEKHRNPSFPVSQAMSARTPRAHGEVNDWRKEK
jgi:hypothetical protein